MSFLMYDIAFLVIFCLGLFIFLYKRRKRLDREGVMYLYRTKVGIKLINYIGGKYKKTISFLGFLGIISGYLLMIAMVYFLGKLVYVYLFAPEIVRAIKIPPVMPLIPYIDRVVSVSFLPPFYFTYWIIAIAVLAVFHEFAHGIVARRYKIKIKTTGFGFLGPFLAAFVEPDEKQMNKKPNYQQIAVLSAGTFTNLILAIFFFLLLSVFFMITYVPSGIMFNSYAVAIANVNSIEKIGNYSVINSSNQGLIDLIDKNNIQDDFRTSSGINYTEVEVDGKTFFRSIKDLKGDLNLNSQQILLYYDFPAIRAGLAGTITAIDDKKVSDQKSIASLLGSYSPGDEVKITTTINGKISDYNIKLSENPLQKGKPVIGITYIGPSSTRILGKVYNYFSFFRENGTAYSPRYNSDFIIFIYNLIWWLAIINFSVALMNMLPFTIFDGGRFFMLTIESITRSKKFAEWTFRIVNWIIVGIIFILMYGWVVAVFNK